MANRYTWTPAGQDEQNIVGSRLADQIQNRLSLAGFSMPAQRDIALAELLARRWELDFTSVMSYGAIGDGAADETQAFRDAVTAAGEGGTLIVPRDKTFRLTETVLLQEGQTVTGGGIVEFVPATPNIASGAFSNAGCTTATGYTAAGNITISDITILSATANGLVFAHADGIRILGVRSTAWYHHIADIIACKNVVIGDCFGNNSITTNANGSAIQVDQALIGGTPGSIFQNGVETNVHLDDTSCRDVIVRNNIIESNTQSWGLHLHRSGHTNVTFTGNIVRDCLQGFHADPSQTHERILIVGNQFEGSSSHAVSFQANAIEVRIDNNIVHGTGTDNYGIFVSAPDSTTRDVSISGNTVTDYTNTGIRAEGLTNFAINNNVIFNPTGAGLRRGITAADCTQGTITGNAIDCNLAQGSSVGSSTPGILVARSDAGTNQDITVSGNHITRVIRGIWVTNNSENINVTGNTISVVSDRGILLGDANGTYTFKGCTVSGNAVRNFNRSGIVVEKPTQCTVNGNSVYDCVGSGVDGRGIQLFSAGTGNLVVGNTADGVNSVVNSRGIMIGCTESIVALNQVRRWNFGLDQETAILAGVVYIGNMVRGNTVDSTVNAGFGTGEHVFALNWLGTQTTPMILPPVQLDDLLGGQLLTGSGSPEGAITAPIGSLFVRVDGGTSTTLYVKESGAGNTGWVAK